jgi:catechol 2,3-dioxygenase-like lactoylglutathione lyase family enzyme
MDFDHIGIICKDLEKSRAFYVECLGARVTSKDSPHFLELMVGNVKFHFIREGTLDLTDPQREIKLRDHFCLNVKGLGELEALQQTLKTSGAQFIDPKTIEVEESIPLGEGFQGHAESRPPLRTLFFTDPNGAVIEVRAYFA